MATPTLVATAGAVNANSYLTSAEADTYHDSRLSSDDWSGASANDKIIALIMATRILDAMYLWEGYQTSDSDSQALRWPRFGLLHANQLEYVDSNVIPQELKNAAAEFARQLIIEDRTLDDDLEAKKIRSFRAGPVSLTFDSGISARVIPDAVRNLMPSWWGYPSNQQPMTLDVLRG